MALNFVVTDSFNPDVNYKHVVGTFAAATDYPTDGEAIAVEGADPNDVVFLMVAPFLSTDIYYGARVENKLQFIKAADGSQLANAAYPTGFLAAAKFYAIIKTGQK
jgi:hypothetical protein